MPQTPHGQDSSAPDPTADTGRYATIRTALIPIIIYLIGALYLMSRVLPDFSTAIPGMGIAIVDAWQNTWNLWWVRLALSQGRNPYFTDMLFAPDGMPLYLHTLNITNALITMPVNLIAGPLAAYNTALIIGLVLTGFATYLLAMYIIGHRGIACAAGALFTFGPFHVAKLYDGHLSWVTVFWIPFYLLCLLHALDSGSRRWRILAGVVLAGATFTSYYYALFSFLFTGLLLLIRLPAAVREGRWRSELVSLALIGMIAGILVAPLLLPAIQEYRTQPEPLAIAPDSDPVWDRETFTYSADLVDLVFPSPFHPLWGEWANQQHAAMRYGWFWMIAPGYGMLILAVIGVYTGGRRTRPWALMVALLWVLMLGPELRVLGVQTGIRMPFDLLQYIPGMKLGHRPNHLAIYMLPLLAILAGFGMQTLLQRGRAGRIILGILGALIVIDIIPAPAPIMPITSNPILAQLRNQPGAVLDLPNVQRNAPAMIHQMIHGRPIIGGYLPRPPEIPYFPERAPWFRQFWRLKLEDMNDIVAYQPDDARQAFSFYNVGSIIVRKNELPPERIRRMEQIVDHMFPGLQPAYTSLDLDAYTIEPVTTRRLFAFLGSGWYDRETSDTHMWRWMQDQGTFYIVNPEPVKRLVTLEFSAVSYLHPRPVVVSLDEQLIGAYQITPDLQTIQVQLKLSPGEHVVRFDSPATPEPPPAQRNLSLMVTRIGLTVSP